LNPVSARFQPLRASASLAAAAAPGILFILLGLLLVPYPGLQQDEVLFAAPLFQPSAVEYAVHWHGREIPIMVMTYLGCLKTWIFAGLFSWVTPTVWSVRVPALLLTALSIGLAFRLLDRLHGKRAAWIATLLLATDACFLLTATFDWGPVALHHVLWMAGQLSGYEFYRHRRKSMLLLTSFLLGLALWDKALFTWSLIGVVSAVVLLAVPFRSQRLWPLMSTSSLAIALLGFSIGAGPLILYNVHSGLATFRSSAKIDLGDLPGKVSALEGTLNGSGLFGYLVHEPDSGDPRLPTTAIERTSLWINDTFGEQRTAGLPWALAAALLCMPIMRPRTRLIAGFFLVCGAVTWLMMAITREAGGSPHHVILFWPVPEILVALAFADLSQRWAALHAVTFVCTFVLVCLNLLIVNQYLSQFIRFGSPGPWTMATHRLIERARDLRDEHRFIVSDWGIDNPLRVALQGRLNLDFIGMPEKVLNEHQRGYYRDKFRSRGTLWVTHVESDEIWKTNAAVSDLARDLGCDVLVLETITDLNGRPTYEIRAFREGCGEMTASQP
jgi:hypothetical protein